MENRVELQPAFILHSRPYRDTSAIIDFFTRDFGRVSAVAKGVRRAKSPWRASLQPFRLVLVSWNGKTELKSIIDIELVESPFALIGKALLSSLYLNELLVRLTHRFDAHQMLFQDYQRCLTNLSAKGLLNTDIEKELRHFEQSLLREVGYGLSLELEVDGVTPVYSEHTYRFDPQNGFERVEGIVPLDILGVCFKGQSLLSIANGCYDNDFVLREAKRLMRLALAPHIGAKPLESRKLFL